MCSCLFTEELIRYRSDHSGTNTNMRLFEMPNQKTYFFRVRFLKKKIPQPTDQTCIA